jgi:4-amino-4-deoxy-L-arabinose transferase-like glycosyltransferase
MSVRDVGAHTDDERDYLELATSIEAGRGFAYADRGPTSIRPPFYPAFIATLRYASGTSSLQLIRAAQILLALASVVIVFALTRRLFDAKAAKAAAIIWCFYPSFLYAGILILTEVLFTVLLLTACASAILALDCPRHGTRWSLLTGIALGLAALTRSVLWPLPLILAPLLACLAQTSRGRRIAMATALIAGYVGVVGPWAVRNTLLQKTFVVVDTMGGLNLRMGNYEFTVEDRMWDGVSRTGVQSWSHAMVAAHPDAVGWTEGQRERWARQQAVTYILAHPKQSARRAVLKFADFWGLEREYVAAIQRGAYNPPRWFVGASALAVVAVYVATMLLACVGLFTVAWRDWRLHLVPLVLVLWICGMHTLVFGHSRYHLPVMPMLAIYAAAAVAQVHWLSWRTSVWRSTAVLTTCIGLGLIWSRELLVRDFDRLRQFIDR